MLSPRHDLHPAFTRSAPRCRHRRHQHIVQPASTPLQLNAARGHTRGRPPDAIRGVLSKASCLVRWTAEVYQKLSYVNTRVNAVVEFVSDLENLGLEDDWDFPRDCRGDCEDFVLEKRERLVDLGFARASLTIAFAVHEVQFFPHAVLLAETTTGTWVLDNLYDQVLCWDAVPYRYTRREQPEKR
jgi:predicted transglutaminase-like cysteine proteinase